MNISEARGIKLINEEREIRTTKHIDSYETIHDTRANRQVD